VSDVLLENQLAFRAHALADGPMDERERAIDDRFVAMQQIVDETHEEILEFCHIARVGRRGQWHTRKRREREQMYGELRTA
jgi:hypothetical protein